MSFEERRFKMNIALYMRMSTDKQENSIDSQRVVLERYAKAQKMNIVKVYVDEGLSGRTAAAQNRRRLAGSHCAHAAAIQLPT